MAPAFHMLSRMFSPYQLNPLDVNPLRGVLEDVIDFEALRDPRAPRLFISATDLKQGRAVSHSKNAAKTYAPKVFAKKTGISMRKLETAMEELFEDGTIIVGKFYSETRREQLKSVMRADNST